MPRRDPHYFIVKHGLDSFEKLPNYVWNTEEPASRVPHRYKEILLGDRWIGFAYTTRDRGERSLSLVTGFFECVTEHCYRGVPKKAREKAKMAWMIKGEDFGKQPGHPVGVPPLHDLLQRGLWNNQAITPITEKDFKHIRDYALRHQFNPAKIPLLGREPRNEQEMLAVIVSCHKKLGITKICGIQTAFPDLLVKLRGSQTEVHLELEIYGQSFFLHGHHRQVRGRFCKKDGKPVAVLCWINNNKSKPLLGDCVHRVYELQSLIRDGKTIRW